MSKPQVKSLRYEAKNCLNCGSAVLARTSRGLKWFVRLKPRIDSRTPYFFVIWNSFASSASTERNRGKRVASAFLTPTKFCATSRIENGKPLRHSKIGEMVEREGNESLPQPMTRCGTSKERFAY